MKNKAQRASLVPFVSIVALFFMWGFITCMNDMLIPQMKEMFQLNRAGSMFVQFCFFGAYFIGSLLYFLCSAKWGDPIGKIGYKRGILAGLFLSALGCALFYPASSLMAYPLFLVGLFVIGLGFTILQIAANPYVTILGAPEGASGRLNLSQAFNSLGTTLAPMLGGLLLSRLGDAAHIHIPYLLFCALFILLAVVIAVVPLPSFRNEERMEGGATALRDPLLRLGIAAIFCYVGAEVCIGSSFINCAQELVPDMARQEAANYLAFYWGGLMIGRFLGSLSLIPMNNAFKKYGLMTLVALTVFGILLIINYFLHPDTFSPKAMLPFIIFIVVNVCAFAVGKSQSVRLIGIFAGVNIVFLCGAMLINGVSTLWFLLATGLFNSVMWANIFSAAIARLGQHTAQGSSLLVMAILGGALLPPVQGVVADALGGYHYSYFIPILAFCYLIFFSHKAVSLMNKDNQ